MTSVASGGPTERIAARIFFIALRAGSGMAAMYSSTVLGAADLGAAFLAASRFGAAFFEAVFLETSPLEASPLLRPLRRIEAEGRFGDFMRAMLQGKSISSLFANPFDSGARILERTPWISNGR